MTRLFVFLTFIFLAAFVISSYFVILSWKKTSTQVIKQNSQAIDAAKQIQQKALDLKEQEEGIFK